MIIVLNHHPLTKPKRTKNKHTNNNKTTQKMNETRKKGDEYIEIYFHNE